MIVRSLQGASWDAEAGGSAYISLQTLVGVGLRGEAGVWVRALCSPGLTGHTKDGDGGGTSVRCSVSNFTV